MLQMQTYREGLLRLCDENKAVRKLYLFGSALTPRFSAASDIDVLIEPADLPPEEKGEGLLRLWNSLESLFGRRIDLLTTDSLRNPFLKDEIERSKKLVYDGQSKQVFI